MRKERKTNVTYLTNLFIGASAIVKLNSSTSAAAPPSVGVQKAMVITLCQGLDLSLAWATQPVVPGDVLVKVVTCLI